MFEFCTTQKKEEQYPVIIYLYHAQASEPKVDLRDQLIVLVRLVYSWKLNSTLVTNVYLVR